MEASQYLGGCLCGNIRFRVSGKPLKPHTCSCSQCQRHSGAPTLSWVEYPKDAVEWIGEGGMPALYRSSDFSSRSFCSRCGSSLGAIDDDPVIALVIGSLDEKHGLDLRPQYHAFVDSRPRWWTIDSGS